MDKKQITGEVSSPSFPPAGFVDRHEAARMLGIGDRTLSTWESMGRVSCGRVVPVPGKSGTAKIYPVEELRRLAGRFQAERELKASEPFPPPGFVARDEARRIFGVAVRTWVTWESEGRISCGRLVRVPGNNGNCKIYPVQELQKLAEGLKRLKEEAIRKLQPYPDRQLAGCWRVPVSSELRDGMEAIIDAEALPLVRGKRVNWCLGGSGQGSVVLPIGRTFRQLHQLVMGVNGTRHRVSHLNGDPLDCRRANLVVRTPSEQKAATRKAFLKGGKPCSSRFKGVHFEPAGRKWSATITMAGQTRQLGRFLSEIDAALVYDAAARELYGQHARPNFADPAEAERLRSAQPPADHRT
jgi:hypothetical protein